MTTDGPPPLRLLAEDADDLQILAAAMQDAVVRVGDIRFDPHARTLTLAMNRFQWERQASGAAGFRVRAALQFGGVMKVHSRNIRKGAADAVLALLTLGFAPGDPPGGVISLVFAGGGDLRLEVECVDAALSDIGTPWLARQAPAHDGDDA